ncbi:MAG TPA: ferritin-like domain-containing protein [Thermoanaerobaculia bacterium]|nr:ferritin-like domain-containing protein [Thermoanaerobaculia bacterium]
MKVESLRELFLHELQDIYDAEKQLVDALPKMEKAASAADLKSGFAQHLRQTEGQVSRLERVFEQLGEKAKGKTCEAMKGLVKEGNETVKLRGDDATRDAALIAAAQKVEHYEIATYGTLCTWAEMLGEREAMNLLKQNLTEEKQTNEKLTKLAESHINVEALTR